MTPLACCVGFGPDGRVVERAGKDLREVGLLVGSGGVLRHLAARLAEGVIASACGDRVPGGWLLLPRAPRTVIDRDHVGAPAGLLAAAHPQAARAWLGSLLEGRT